MLSSAIAETELLRAARRISDQTVKAAPRVLSVVALMEVSREILSSASLLEPASLRTLDSIHLATALELADELDSFVTYDFKLAEAARSAGLPVAQPGR